MREDGVLKLGVTMMCHNRVSVEQLLVHGDVIVEFKCHMHGVCAGIMKL